MIAADSSGGSTLSAAEKKQVAAIAKAMGISYGQALAVMESGGSSSSSTQNPQVWLPGKKKTSQVPGRYMPSMGGVDLNPMQGPPSTRTRTVGRGGSDAQGVSNWVYDPGKLKQIQSYLEKRGFEVNSWSDVNKYWQSAVQQASDAYESSGHKIKKSPWDMLDLVAPTKDEIAKRGPWKGLNYSETHTTKHIDEIGPEQARTVITGSLRDLLGRDPTQEEIEDFASRANAIVGQHPQVTKETTSYVWDPNANGPGEGGYVPKGSTSTTSGGVTGDMLTQEAEDEAKSNKDYGAFQAATTVSNWLVNAINSPE